MSDSLDEKIQKLDIALQKVVALETITQMLADRLNVLYSHIKNINDGVTKNDVN